MLKTRFNNFAFVLLLFALSFDAVAQQTPRQVAGLGSVKGFMEYLPPGYNSNTDKYPVLIFLHGSGERGDGSNSQLGRVTVHGPPKHIKNGHDMCFTVGGTTECFVVLSPQQGTSQWGWNKDVVPFVDYALANYRIDPDRVYLTGLSMGGDGCWDGMRSDKNVPNRFAAVAPIAGKGQYAEGCTAGEREITIWIHHGDADKSTPLNSMMQAYNGAKDCGTGPDPLLTIYTGAGHGRSWQNAYRTDNALNTPNLYQWFLAQRKGSATPQPPTVNAGTDQSITLPTNSTSLTGTASDSDGSIASYEWTRTSGPGSVSIATPAAASTNVSTLAEGIHIFNLKVTDNSGLSADDDVRITVLPEPANMQPTAMAGDDVTITLPTSAVSLVGGGMDSDGTIASYQWSQLSGPNTATVANFNLKDINPSGLVEGLYVFQLTATDDDGADGSDLVNVTVQPEPPNNPPTALAGSNVTIVLPTNSIVLNGSGTDTDGTIVSYNWTRKNGPSTPTIADPTMSSITLNNLVEGVYTYTLTVTDDDGAIGTDNVVIRVDPDPANDPPTAIAGDDQSITLPTNTTMISGNGSDTDGTIASYLWAQLSGPNTATTTALNTQNVTLSNLVEGQYIFTLTVTDDDGDQGSDQVVVQVLPEPPNDPPVAEAGGNKFVQLPANSTNLNGSGTDTDGTISSYSWMQTSGPGIATIGNDSNASTSVSNLIEGVYVFTLTVTDDGGKSNSDQVTVTVLPIPPNEPPTAVASSDVSITLPINTVSLSGVGSSDIDGTIASYEWSQTAGPAGPTIASSTTIDTDINNLVEGVFTFTLTVTDDDGATGTDQVEVTVFAAANVPPTAIAGSDVTITLPTNSVNLNGAGTDSDGSITSYLWAKTGGAAGSIIDNINAQNISISNLAQGVHIFSLTVTDDDGDTGSDLVSVTVNPEPFNNPPDADAGADINLTLPMNTATLNGSGTDSDGTVVKYTWSNEGGPGQGSASDLNQPILNLSDLVEGIYIFLLTVEDDDGAIGTDQVRVIVDSPNMPPVVDAGNDITLELPTNSTTLNGVGTDTDGTVDFYLWGQQSGPTTATISDAFQPTLNVSNLSEGVYTFSLYIEDNEGASNTDFIDIIVNPEPANIPPTADAGMDQVITLPLSQATFSGSGSDTDGSITAFVWNQVSGPNTATSTDVNMEDITFSDLIEGNYVFKLTVTDDGGAKGSADVNLRVNPKPGNDPPVVDAGTDKVITLPVNSTSLTAVASDIDGSVVSYQWSVTQGPAGATFSAATSANTDVNNLLEGVYTLRVTVEDDGGETSFDEIDVTVNPEPANQPPVANAGTDISIFLPTNTTSINGSGTDSDGSITTYLWTQQSGPSMATLVGENTGNLMTSNLLEGIYVFRLTVTDDEGAMDFDEVDVTVNPEPFNAVPMVNAGADIQITLPTNATTLNGTATDSDGSIASNIWTQQSGPNTATTSDLGQLSLSLSDLVEGVYVFRLTATDDEGDSDFDEIDVRVNPVPPNEPPVVDAGADVEITLPTNTASFNATVTDEDLPSVTYNWIQVSGPSMAVLAGETTTDLTVSSLIDGVYLFRLTATDAGSEASIDEVRVTVNPEPANIPPSVNAGADVAITLPVNQASLSGSATDSDGTVVTYLWEQRSGPSTATLTGSDTENLMASNLVEGVYIFRLSATDDGTSTTFDEAQIFVNPPPSNGPPMALAGDDITLPAGQDNADLNGSGTDSDGSIASYLWTQTDGPSSATISDEFIPNPNVSDLIAGTYIFKLQVIDDKGASDEDEVNVFVKSNIDPIAFAGEDTTLTAPVVSLLLKGGGSDADGTIVEFSWSQNSGPNTATLDDPANMDVTITNLVAGLYSFSLSVTDNLGATATDDIIVEIIPEAGSNLPPVVSLGTDVEIELPTSAVSLNAEAKDEDGTITTYLWEQLNGPDNASFSSTTLPQVIVGNLISGTYEFKVSVTDNGGATASDEIVVTVKEAELTALEVPKILSPNGDDMNQFWVIPTIDALSQCKVAVYAQNGEKVFEADPYENNWDGTFNGKPLPEDAYFYLIKCDNGTTRTGGLRIVR